MSAFALGLILGIVIWMQILPLFEKGYKHLNADKQK